MAKKPNILITLAIAATLVTALSFVLPKDAEKYLAELFWTRKTFAPAKYNVVIMGDSRVYRGLSPEIMESHLPGLKVLNFAYSNGGLNQTMFVAAEKKLAQNANPKIILLGISANAISGYSAQNQQYVQELNRPREEIFERIYFNPLRYWFSATSPEKLKNHYSETKETAFYRNKYFMNGYVESEKFPADTMEAIPSYTKDFANYKVTPKNLSDLFKQVKKWTDSGIIVAGFIPPVSQPMQMLEDTLGRFDETVIKTGFEMASGHWIDVNPNKYKTYDGSHLNIESARKLSNEIAEEVQQLTVIQEKK
ncbi:MAG TPA: hypothetical protein PLC80_05290 [Draconibacterium sp.]|nr:hypothetical protein [Draconibacterium sp.]